VCGNGSSGAVVAAIVGESYGGIGYGEEVFIDESIRGQRRRIKRASHQNDDRLHCQEALGDREEPRVYESLCI